MIKGSTELIALARECVRRELERSIEKGKQPSFYEIFYEAYFQGLADGKDVTPEDLRKTQDWHYIETEGVPDNEDDRFWCLIKCDGYYDYEKGWYEVSRGRWQLDYNPPMGQVIAWHKLPENVE